MFKSFIKKKIVKHEPFEILSADVYSKVCPPDQTLMLRSTSKKLKALIDSMGLEVHIKIKSSDIDNIIKNLNKISKNYIITKIEFSKSYTILMFINLDIIRKLCPFLTHLDLGSNHSYDFGLERFKTNLPKCNVIQYMFSSDCKRIKEKREYAFGRTYCYEWYNHNKLHKFRLYNNLVLIADNDIEFNNFPSMKLRDDREIVLAAVQQDKIPLKTKLAYKIRDHETKALNKRFHRTNKSQYYNTNALNQRYQKKY